MEMNLVKSSAMHSMGYDASKQLLHVAFKEGGQVFQYHGVSTEAHGKLMAAESVGKHFALHIKPMHKSSKLEEEKKNFDSLQSTDKGGPNG